MSSSSKSRRQSEDFISNVPDNVADKILGRLPILMAARTSVLSKQWRRNWLSLSCLNFDMDFWEAQKYSYGITNWKKGRDIISSILILRNSPIQTFCLVIPPGLANTIEQWKTFLAEHAVRYIRITNPWARLPIVSQIFSCNRLELLELSNFTLNPLPTGFKGFPKLKHLALLKVRFTQPDLFCSLIANSHQLTLLQLENWTGMDHVVIDVPTLRSLTLKGVFESLVFRNVSSLKTVVVRSLKSWKSSTTGVIIKDACLLASSSKLHCIQFNGRFAKALAAGGITISHPVAFKHLKRLRLSVLELSDISVFRFVFGMMESCRRIKELKISVVTSKVTDEHKVEYKKDHKLRHLLKIRIRGITGSSAELKLIEYLLTVSVVLEEMLLCCNKLDTEAEQKVSRAVMGFRRTSTKARVVYS